MAELAIALAIPVFFSLIALEWVIARWQGRSVYRFADAISCLSCGIGQQMTGLLWKVALFGAYIGAYELFAIASWDASSPWVWVAGFLLVDHQYYWWHRVTHRSKAFWTTHVVHHQSEDYNLAVALRQTWFSSLSGVPFYLPLAIIGIPPVVFAVCEILNTLYQFWIHTELIGKLGPLEWVMNTPSHHRVHHAVDPKYIDKNYAGVFIIWDRAYGTFTAEEEHPTYGTVKPLKSYNPVWANIEPLVSLARDTAAVQPADRLRFVFGPPEWRPDELGGPLEIPEPEPGRLTWDVRAEPEVHAYIAAHFVVVAAVVTTMLYLADGVSYVGKLAVVGGILWTTSNWAGLFEQRAWARPSELVRLVVLPVATLAGWAAGGLAGGWVVAALLISASSVAWLLGPARAVVDPTATPGLVRNA